MHRLNRIGGSFKYCLHGGGQAMSTPGSSEVLKSSQILAGILMYIFLGRKSFKIINFIKCKKL